MDCQNPERCSLEAAKWKAYQDNHLQIAEIRLECLRASLQRGENALGITFHGGSRQAERCISGATVRLLVNEEAWPFEYYEDSYGTEKIGLVGHVKVGGKKYRPMHIILKRTNEEDLWNVVTVYDPRTEQFRWGNNYQGRICFCK